MVRLRLKPNAGFSFVDSARWIFLSTSILCFALCAWAWLDSRLHQAEDAQIFTEEPMPAASDDIPITKHQPIAKLEIARLGVHGYVEVGLDSRTLDRAIGLAPRGARPGEAGNIVLAAHRDTFFAGLKNAKAGDLITLQARDGKSYHYRISRTFVVNPSDTWVLRATPGRKTLTLITCYPFRFAGNAPQRFVVQAQLMDGPPPRRRVQKAFV